MSPRATLGDTRQAGRVFETPDLQDYNGEMSERGESWCRQPEQDRYQTDFLKAATLFQVYAQKERKFL